MPRRGPVLPNRERTSTHLTRSHQIGMQVAAAALWIGTSETHAIAEPVFLSAIAARRALLAGVVGSHFHDDTPRQRRLVGDERAHLSKGPLGILPPLALACALCALPNVGQVFEAEERGGCHQAGGHLVIGACFEPSFSERELTPACGRAPSAFVSQAFPHPLEGFSLVDRRTPGEKLGLMVCGGAD